MKTFIFMLCMSVFGLTPKNGTSQNALIAIDEDQTITLEGVFNLIKTQTNYHFVYNYELIENAPEIKITKGVIKLKDLLNRGLNPASLTYDFNKDTVVVRRKNLSNQSSQVDPFKITGTIKDEQGLGLPGVTVYVSSREPSPENPQTDFIVRGTVTDFDGNFTIDAIINHYLVVSGMGYDLYYEQITSENKKEYSIALKKSLNELNEVIIVGYGTTTKKDLTGSIGSVRFSDIERVKTQTVDQALIGKIPGLQVQANGGSPGSGAVVHIRGLSQLRGDNQPLYVIDGVPVVVNPNFQTLGLGTFGDRENPLLAINPDDVERIDVLKDASAAAIYGSRAANGVIIITTKRGKRNQKPRFNFSWNSTFQNPTNTHDLLNAQQYRQFTTDQAQAVLDSSPVPQQFWPFAHPNELQIINDPDNFYGNGDTDWQDLITNENALWSQYKINVSGGSDKVNYFVSAGASDQEGVLLGNKFIRYNIGSNLDANLTDRLNTGFSLNYNHSTNRQSGITNLSTAFWRPDQSVFNEDGTFTTLRNRFGFETRNPLGDAAMIRNKAISQNIVGSVYGEYKIFKALKFKSQLSINLNNDRSSVFSPSYTENALFAALQSSVSGATLRNQRSDGFSSSFANTLNYYNTIGDHHRIDAVAGVSWDRSRLDLESQTYTGFPDDENLTNIQSATEVTNYDSEAIEQGLNSIFGRLNYVYKDRYLLTFTGRYDESTKFGPDNRGGFFPSGAIAWNVHNENFLSGSNFINQLKFRASMGRTGSDNLPSFSYLAILQTLDNNDSFYDGVNGILVPGVPNNAIKWETTDQLDVGVEFGLFGGRLNGEVTYFNKDTKDIILLVPVPSQTGSDRFNGNIADVSNNGWEISVGGDIIRNENFNWNSSFNISFIKNKVESLKGGITSSFGSSGIIEGEPIGVISGYDVVGIAQTQDEIDQLNANAPNGFYFSGLSQPGDYIYRDVNGDGEINDDDLTPLGDINPDYFGGWSNTITYKNFDFSFNFQYVQGNERLWSRASNLGFLDFGSNFTDIVFDTWSPDNTQATYARIGSQTHSFSGRATSKSVEDASYIRLKTASLGFNIPKRWLEKTGIRTAKITLSGNNLITITDYPGPDPENVNLQRGGATVDLTRDDGLAYPNTRTYTMGLNIDF